MRIRQALALVLVVAGGLPISAQDKPVSTSQHDLVLTIEELFGLVEENSSSLRAEKTGVQFADQGVAAAKTERLPDIQTSLSASYNGNILMMDRDFTHVHGYSSPHFGNSLAVEAQQVVYSGGAVSAGIRMAELGREQAEVGVELTRQQLRFLALGQFLELAKLKNRREVYEKNIALTERLIADIKSKAEQGMALRNDVTRYELQLEQLRLGLRRVDDQYMILNQQLLTTLMPNPKPTPSPSRGEGSLTTFSKEHVYSKANQTLLPWGEDGDGFQVEIVPVIPTPSMVPQSIKQAKDGSNQTPFPSGGVGGGYHPLSRLSQLATQQAEQRERLAKSDLLPKVALVAANNFSGPFTYDIPPLNKNLNYWFLGVGVKYSLSSLYKGKRKLEQAHTAVRRAAEQQRVTDEQVANSVYEAQTLYEQSFADLDTQRKSVELATQNYEVVNERYLNQLVLVTDMLDASNIRLNAELQEVDAHIQTIYAYYRMLYAAGQI
ncbi:MAG: TolC family protein [Prevotella sp.]|nr:TolC family protein [Prevotella sp.]